uniref:Ion transport domain-containing protein n=1 Tax=Pyrodinium bahamense TaxID=73915 RepID=A0A7S0B581_9DINO
MAAMAKALLTVPGKAPASSSSAYQNLPQGQERLASAVSGISGRPEDASAAGEDTSDEEAVAAQSEVSARWSATPFFQGLTASVIIANTGCIAIEAALIQHEDLKPVFEAIEAVFTVLYVLEIVMRLREQGLWDFFFGNDHMWDWFDFCITLAGVIDTVTVVLLSQKGSGASVCRLFRIMRIMRLFRAARFLGEIEDVLILSIKATAKLASIVALVVFVSAIVVTNLLYDVSNPKVAASFADLQTSMWSVFLMMTLDNWSSRAEDVLAVRPSMWVFYTLFVFVAGIALMSLVPALFIEINLTQREKTKVKEAARYKRQIKREQRCMLNRLFEIVDRDSSGLVSIAEMQKTFAEDGMVRRLQFDKLTSDGDLLDVKLALFDLSERLLEETGTKDAEMNKRQFVEHVMEARDDPTNQVLWRSGTATRWKVAELMHMATSEHKEGRSAAGRVEEGQQELHGAVQALQAQVVSLRGAVDSAQAEAVAARATAEARAAKAKRRCLEAERLAEERSAEAARQAEEARVTQAALKDELAIVRAEAEATQVALQGELAAARAGAVQPCKAPEGEAEEL